jgi:hypothetical protein
MNNTIISPRYFGDLSGIDSLLPFDNKEVGVYNIEYCRSGYGRYKLTLSIDVDNVRALLTSYTDDSRMIDEWRTRDGELNIKSIRKAIEHVLEHNQLELEEFIHMTNDNEL